MWLMSTVIIVIEGGIRLLFSGLAFDG